MKRTLPASIFFTTLFLFTISAQAQKDRFAYAITDLTTQGNNWHAIRKLNLQTGEYSAVIFNGIAENWTAYDAASKKELKPDPAAKNKVRFQKPFYSGVAAMAYDRRHNRLYFTPMFVDQLRYIDLTTMKLYYLSDQPFTGLGNLQKDPGKVVTRMAIAPDGNGYALTNDGSVFVRFTTGKKPTITQLGSLVDDPSNKGISIHNSCTSFGGDMIADDEGNFYLITARNHVFTIQRETRIAKHMGVLENLPKNFTVNGMVVDADGALLVSSAVDTTAWYVVDHKSLKTKRYEAASSVFRSSDLANSNFLSTTGTNTIPAMARHANLVQVYPNPVTTNRFTLQFDNISKGIYTVEVMDMTGRPVSQSKVTVFFDDQTQTITLSSVRAKGIYLVQLADLNKKVLFRQKLMVQ